jgi:hypothetical protein
MWNWLIVYVFKQWAKCLKPVSLTKKKKEKTERESLIRLFIWQCVPNKIALLIFLWC